MTLAEAVLKKMETLPKDRQREVLDFVEFLAGRAGGGQPKKSAKGLCADLGAHVAKEDIGEARREMWGSFPRLDL